MGCPCAPAHGIYGRSQRPAFPAPSVRERDNELQSSGEKRAARSRTCARSIASRLDRRWRGPNTPDNQKSMEATMAGAGRTSISSALANRRTTRRAVLGGLLTSPFVARQAFAAETLNAYSIWPENYARPMMEAFEKASGIKVKFVRFSSGEALARVTAEKNNPQIDVLFGGPVETFTAGQGQGLFEPYAPPAASELPARFKDKAGNWTAMADDPLVFMTNSQFLKQNNLQAP